MLLVLLWTPFILLQTWNLQHSCSPLINWGGDRCPMESIKIAPQDFSLKVGESRYLKVGIEIKSDIKDKSSVDRSVVWRSSSEKVAAVDGGRVTAIAPGFVTVTAIANKDRSKIATATVTVPGISEIRLHPKTLKIEVRGTGQITADVNGYGKFSDHVDWVSDNRQIADVDSNGLVKGISKGETSVRVVSRQDSSKSETAIVTIQEMIKPERVEISSESKDFWQGETKELTAKVFGIGANSDDVTWISDNPKVASVSGYGHRVTVEALSEGTTIVTTISNQDRSKKAAIQITVSKAVVTDIHPYPEQIDMNRGEKQRLCLKLEGKGNFSREIGWYSNNEQVATVDNGVVNAKSDGKAEIVAYSVQDPEKSAIINIKVPRDMNWLALGAGLVIAVGATAVGVPLPAALALGAVVTTGANAWQGESSLICS